MNKTNITYTTASTKPVNDQAINSGDTAWVLASSCLVFIMIPGLGFYYGGLSSRKSILSMLFSTFLAKSIVSFQWFIWGFSLAFSNTGSSFIGNFDYAFFRNVGNDPYPLAPSIPGNAFMIFQLMFAVLSPTLAFGSAAERTTLSAYCIFIFVWSTVVYDVVAYWLWSLNGWLHILGVLDFAGGTPVHLVSGFAALAYALAVGPRRLSKQEFEKHKPSNINDVYLGTALLWFGWFGFNSGCELSINSRAVNALVVTNMAACSGGLSWLITDMIFRRTKKMSLNAFCAGSVAGLVGITPSSGFVRPHFAILIGFIVAVICYFTFFVKKLTKYKYDDVCDVFAVHGMGGLVGCLLTAIFADKTVVSMAGDSPIDGGWIDHNYILLAYHLLSICVAAAWSFVLTYLILISINLLPFTKLRLSKLEEEIGMDWIEMGEATYGHDIAQFDDSTLQKLLMHENTTKETNIQIIKSLFSR